MDAEQIAKSRPAPSHEAVEQARAFAAEVLVADAREDLAEIVRRGGGDDFPRGRGSLRRPGRLSDRLRQHAEALRVYADPDFWEDDLPGGPLACHDKGEIARNVLAGRRPFHHRD